MEDVLKRFKVTVVMEDGEAFHWDDWAEDKGHAIGLAHDFAKNRSDLQVLSDFAVEV